MQLDEPMRPWPAGLRPTTDEPPTVGVVTVSWNTRGHLSRLLFGLRCVVPRGAIREIVVVDNASEDGSAELARALAEAGVIHLVANETQRYHGPGLTQGVNLLAELAATGRAVDLVWALDTDVVIVRDDVVADAAAAMGSHGAALAADPDDYAAGPPGITTRRLALCSTLFDPCAVWRESHRPFLEDGEPSRHLQADLLAGGQRLLAFPFCADGYIVHLGRGTLREVAARQATANRYHRWAREHRTHHYAGQRDGPALVAAFEARYRSAVSDDRPSTLIDALT